MKKLLSLSLVAILMGAGCSMSGTSGVKTDAAVGGGASGGAAGTVETGADAGADAAAGAAADVNVDAGGVNVDVGVSATLNVSMEKMAYAPTTITAKKGDKVVFTNRDSVQHNVTANGGAFASANMSTGSTFTLDTSTLAAGTYNFNCTLHPGMTGTLTVK